MGFIRKSRQQNNYTPSGGRVPGRPVDAAHRQSKPQFYDWAKDPEFASSSGGAQPSIRPDKISDIDFPYPVFDIYSSNTVFDAPRPTGRGKISVSIDPILESKWGPGAKSMLEDTLRGKKRDGK